ncbi:Cytochrome c oxidase assembly protein cox19 [Malassezia yamatoensis]|uniref:Cytochrome c oxidase assembly protein COX19 n=1 Tax=Malassezia yamatoensis TaxID=253288 RepID=A0AAJ5YZK7_9BASI|nr:Cytochrome c oxidase assembly protein cox19 [Malassezia yamatoensis]
MSFGRPPTFGMFQVSPPERGSFPLDHYGDCKEAMKEYMKCLKENKNNNGACRHLSKKYLECRMDNDLMERDDMNHLGFADITETKPKEAPKNDSTSRIV